MSWHKVTWSDADGAQPLIDAFTEALDAHPAWEFVEETVEKMTVQSSTWDEELEVMVTGDWYDMLTYPFQVWRCRGDLNGSGEDFYLAFSRTIQGYPDSEVPGEGGYIPVFGATGYDVATHTASGVIGKATWQNVELNEDGEVVGTDGYPWVQPKVEAGGTTWGYWGAPNLEETSYEELTHITRGTQHIMNFTSGRTFQVPYAQPDQPALTTESTVLIRVTNEGFFFALKFEEGNYWEAMHYVGLYEWQSVPEEFRSPVPLIQMGPDEYSWGPSGSQVSLLSLNQLSQGRRSTSSGIGQWFQTPDYYGVTYGTNLTTDTEREKFPAPAIEPYVTYPMGLAPTSESGINLRTPLYIVPGIWLILKGEDAPETWTKDDSMTLTSPDGTECVVLYSEPGNWLVIDKELA